VYYLGIFTQLGHPFVLGKDWRWF